MQTRVAGDKVAPSLASHSKIFAGARQASFALPQINNTAAKCTEMEIVNLLINTEQLHTDQNKRQSSTLQPNEKPTNALAIAYVLC